MYDSTCSKPIHFILSIYTISNYDKRGHGKPPFLHTPIRSGRNNIYLCIYTAICSSAQRPAAECYCTSRYWMHFISVGRRANVSPALKCTNELSLNWSFYFFSKRTLAPGRPTFTHRPVVELHLEFLIVIFNDIKQIITNEHTHKVNSRQKTNARLQTRPSLSACNP